MRIISYNVNGIRAAIKKGLLDWIKSDNPDVFCVQECKALESDLNPNLFKDLGYESYWHSAEKKGYSGVAVFSKKKPLHIEYGCGNPLYDSEGRVIRVDFENLSIMNVYMPSGTSGDLRQEFKMQWLEYFQNYALEIARQKPNLVICGDYNIANNEIDIHNPVSNKKSSGFLPEERAWLSDFFKSGFKDTFRELNPTLQKYSWWTYRANARANNKGWRIDYLACTDGMLESVKEAGILNDVIHSDHCPIYIEIK